MSTNNAPKKHASDRHRLGGGVTVRFDLNGGRLDAEWSPRLPTAREFHRLIERYRAARQVFMESVAATTGGAVIVIEQAAPDEKGGRA